MLSIFTPTYNRAYVLRNLYSSLLRQTNKDFEWIIVDDGSVDNTKSVIDEWIKKKLIDIRYVYQNNSGKAMAHNKGVEMARGELFTCVDSDDMLQDDAVSSLVNTWNEIKDNGYIGILAFRQYYDGKPITKIDNNTVVSLKLSTAKKNYGLVGDTMLVYKTELIRKYSFPNIEGCKFIPEAYLYYMLDNDGDLYLLRKYLYTCEYLPDGYTKNVEKTLFDNYKGYIYYADYVINNSISPCEKFIFIIKKTALLIAHKEKGLLRDSEFPLLTYLAFLPALIVCKKRYAKYM